MRHTSDPEVTASRWHLAHHLTDLRALVRFVAVGFTANGSYGLVFLLVGNLTHRGPALLHVLATAVSTLVANEMHRRFTFAHATKRSWLRGHGVGTATALVGFVATSATLSWWHVVAPGASHLSSVLVVYATTAAVGLGNFLTLRRTLGAHRTAVVEHDGLTATA
ncbi:GtrA family protein [Cellulomonas soli]|uniref:GtrA family protein n=1 Tax=Cellulomonas soli TaxID=931535 RepID=UPI003F864A4D